MRRRIIKIAVPYIVAFSYIYAIFILMKDLHEYIISRSFDNILPYPWFIFVIM